MADPWVEWRPATRQDIETAIRRGLVEPVGIDAEGVRNMALLGLERSIDTRAYFIEGQLVCVIGVIAETLLSQTCHIWLTCMPEVLRAPKTLARHSAVYLRALPYREATCLCDPSFAATVRWVRWLGFTKAGGQVIMGKEYDLYSRTL